MNHYRPLAVLTLSLAAFAAVPQAQPQSKLDGPAPLAWRWATATKEPTSGSPLVAGNTVIAAVGGRLYAIEKTTGNQKWKFPNEALRGNFKNPILTAGTIVAPATNNVMYGIDAKTGKSKWQFTSERDAFYGTPVPTGASVAVGLGMDKIVAVKVDDGKPLWDKPYVVTEGIRGSIQSYGSNVLFFTGRNELISLNTSTQRPNWTQRFDNISTTAQPYVLGSTIYVYSGSYLVALDGASGRLRWQQYVSGDFVFGPAASPAGIMLLTRDGKAFLLDTNGRSKFAEPVELGSIPVAGAAAVGDNFLVATSNGVLNLIGAKDGSVLWSYVVRPVTSGIRDQRGNKDEDYVGVAAAGDPVVSGGTLLVLALDGSLLAFDKTLGVDLTGPEVVMGFPTPGAQVAVRDKMYFAFRVRDESIGVDASDLKITINGAEAQYEYGRDGIAVVRFMEDGANKPLPDGRTLVKVEATDWLGNKTDTTYTLMVDNSLPPLKMPTIGPTVGAAGKGGKGGKGKGGGRAGGGGGPGG